MIELTDCPECGAPAEVRWRAEYVGTSERAGILCARSHSTVVPIESLPVEALRVDGPPADSLVVDTPPTIPTQRSVSAEIPVASRLRRRPARD